MLVNARGRISFVFPPFFKMKQTIKNKIIFFLAVLILSQPILYASHIFGHHISDTTKHQKKDVNVGQDESCATCDLFHSQTLSNSEPSSYYIPKIVIEANSPYFRETYIDLKNTTLSLRGPPNSAII